MKTCNGITLSTRAARGLLWVVTGQGLTVLGQIMTLAVSARLLPPEDFGVFAVGLLLADFGLLLLRPGLGSALIQRQEISREMLDLSFTWNALAGLVLAVVLAACLPFILGLAFDPETPARPLQIMCATIALTGLINPKLAVLERDLERRRLFVVSTGASLARTVVTLAAAWWWRDYWALVAGLLAKQLVELFLSYLVVPFRPRLCWNGSLFLSLYRFSRWLQFHSVLRFMSGSIDSFAVASILGNHLLGFYNRANRLASLPQELVNVVASRIAFPLFARLREDRARISRMLSYSVDCLLCLGVPVLVVVVAAGEEAVVLFMGARWAGLVSTLQILAAGLFLRSLLDCASPLLRGCGHPHVDFAANLVRGGITMICAFPLLHWGGLQGVAIASMIGSAASLPLLLYWIHRLADRTVLSRIARNLFLTATCGFPAAIAPRILLADWNVPVVFGFAGKSVLALSILGALLVALDRGWSSGPFVAVREASRALHPRLLTFGRTPA